LLYSNEHVRLSSNDMFDNSMFANNSFNNSSFDKHFAAFNNPFDL
jgi:hypothetical protein